jgi:hypothetical protein
MESSNNIIKDYIVAVAEDRGLEKPPEGYCVQYKKESGESSCKKCQYYSFCSVKAHTLLSVCKAMIEEDSSFNITDNLESNILIIKSGMIPPIKDINDVDWDEEERFDSN